MIAILFILVSCQCAQQSEAQRELDKPKDVSDPLSLEIQIISGRFVPGGEECAADIVLKNNSKEPIALPKMILKPRHFCIGPEWGKVLGCWPDSYFGLLRRDSPVLYFGFSHYTTEGDIKQCFHDSRPDTHTGFFSTATRMHGIMYLEPGQVIRERFPLILSCIDEYEIGIDVGIFNLRKWWKNPPEFLEKEGQKYRFWFGELYVVKISDPPLSRPKTSTSSSPKTPSRLESVKTGDQKLGNGETKNEGDK
jgi:hypothetical protein